MNKYIITEIYENDYGCEGLPPDAEPELIVVYNDERNTAHHVKMTEKMLSERSLETGCIVTIDSSGLPIAFSAEIF